MRKKASLLFIIFIVLSFTLFPLRIYSIDCSAGASGGHSVEEWNQITQACQEQYTKYSNEKYDAQNQLQLINTKYDLSIARFRQTEQKIEDTQNEIDILNSRIEGLDTSLNYLSKLLIERIVEGYKKRTVSILFVLFDSNNADDLIGKIKYMKTTQDNNQKVLVQVQEAKLNFEEQKKLRDIKKQELDNLKALLAQQQTDLQNQKRKQNEYITSLNNDLAETQRILNIARQQIAGFKSFVSSTGVGVIGAGGLGNGSDGNYYSQRDERWASRSIGYSNESILNVGCLVTSVAMAAKKNGVGVNPADIAADIGRFFGYTAYMKLPWPGVAGKSYTSLSQSDADQELQNGNYVIAGIRRNSCGSGGDHFVVLTKKDGSNYIMHDPIYGPDKKFSDYYSSFCSFATFK
ncbi:hypothetical protein HY041_03275 [Candidatus Roizmanbacteria bacterium]|nr:hypothetical protein [Candidatus Roizmanbacteria bacterium]